MFFQVSLAVERGSFLDVPGMVGKPKFDTLAIDPKIINVDNATALGLYSELNKPVWSLTPGIYGAAFGGKNQAFGWDVRLTYRRILEKPESSSLTDYYSFMTGPIFRIVGEADFSKATIGLKFGLSNAPINTDRLWKDYFAARFEIGVPFKWYNKQKT